MAVQSLHSRVFGELIAEQRQLLVDGLFNQSGDEAFLRNTIGIIRGLDMALRISEQADFKLSGDE